MGTDRQAILSTLAMVMRYGMWGQEGRMESHPFGCGVEACFTWLAFGALFSCGFLRVYRYHDVLVRHNGIMLGIPLQVRTAIQLL